MKSIPQQLQERGKNTWYSSCPPRRSVRGDTGGTSRRRPTAVPSRPRWPLSPPAPAAAAAASGDAEAGPARAPPPPFPRSPPSLTLTLVLVVDLVVSFAGRRAPLGCKGRRRQPPAGLGPRAPGGRIRDLGTPPHPRRPDLRPSAAAAFRRPDPRPTGAAAFPTAGSATCCTATSPTVRGLLALPSPGRPGTLGGGPLSAPL
ncbi:unnamed protein product [Urochloa humidicola]